MAKRATRSTLSDAQYHAAMVRCYRGYSVAELRSGIRVRKLALATNTFLTKRERLNFESVIRQMTYVLTTR